MTLPPVPLPLGRVPVPQIPRFADKPRAAERLETLDLSAWVGQVPGDPITACSVTVFPAVPGGVTLLDPVTDGVSIGITSAEGVAGQDYQLTFTYSTAARRTDQTIMRLFVI